MKRNKLSFVTGIALSVGYVFLIVYYIFNLINLPAQYRLVESKAVEKVESEVSRYVDDYSVTHNNQFSELSERYPLDLIVLEDDEIVYKSSKALDIDLFFDIVSDKAVLYEAKGSMGTDTASYRFLVRLYHFPDDVYLMPFLSKQIIILSLSFIIITLAFFFIMNSVLKPLRKAKESLEHLQNFEFDQIKSSDDVINQKLSHVSSQIGNAMTQASHRYTDFEKDLEISRQRLNNAMVVSRSFVHDLKSPVHQQIMMNELIVDEVDVHDTPITVASMNIGQSTKLMDRLNEILKVLNQDNLTFENNISDVDVTSLTYSTLRYFGQNFTKKHLLVTIDAPETCILQSNEVILQLLIHNLMSNISQYALTNSDVLIRIVPSDDTVELIYENQSTQENIQRMHKSENLFNVLSDNYEHKHSSGNGLFLIKDLATLANGNYDLQTNDDTIIITIKLPMQVGDDYEESR